ncbi:rhomboid family intramembrane serine protease [Lishizhenia sp.]|uniref:rhomboid family intramembrane serine protease n=1 Tax=Lishizhenia sp. TaxID=2497594 RepID=UPI00299E1ABC|nr:rhomboid family intramembrane serine protease [Lishizhenia sp.]MDX1446056.1 rhomboid family intramembrane serine protease [Lishizhenia sp.]
MSRTFTEEIKYQWNYGGMYIKLIGINLAVFLLINIALAFAGLLGYSAQASTHNVLQQIFVLHGDFKGLLTHPWGLFTSIFAHFGFYHLLMNMLVLFFVGRMFEQFFTKKQLLYTYLLGGVVGGLVQIIAHQLFPGLQASGIYVVGASGSVMAIFMAVAFYRPNMTVHLFGILPVRIILLAGLYLLSDLINISKNDQIAHFAHLGGALIGYLSVQNLGSPKNIIARLEQLFSKSKQPKVKRSKMKVVKNKKYNTRSDEAYNEFKNIEQEQVDAILEKIKKAGYDSLTKREKEILFEYSRNVK